MHALETYLQDLRATRSSGGAVKETSYYPALANLLNELVRRSSPKCGASFTSRTPAAVFRMAGCSPRSRSGTT